MTFTSTVFFIGLLPWFILIYKFCKENETLRKLLLMFANITFYVWGGKRALLLLCFFVIIVWVFVRLISKYRFNIIFRIGVITIILPLLAIKYTNFVFENINIFAWIEFEYVRFPIILGLSFFTFQAISLLVDAYNQKITTEITLIDTFLYLSFFPTVTSGPIMRFQQFQEGMYSCALDDKFSSSIERLTIGFVKKVLVADKIAVIADYYFNGVADGQVFSCVGLWIGSIAYSLQLYFDFSGYSDMAIGIGGLLGFQMPENFNAPYRAKSISDFWRRWHISLSQWFRDYIYIPLGGNRCTYVRHIMNMLVVWLLTGVWHGADWAFIIWGLGYFVLLVGEKYFPALKQIDQKWYRSIYTLFFVNLLWVPFRAANINHACTYILGMFGYGVSFGGLEKKAIHFIPYIVLAGLALVPWGNFSALNKHRKVVEILKKVCLAILFLIGICSIVNASYTPYIYGNF